MPKKIDYTPFINAALEMYPNKDTLTRTEVIDICRNKSVPYPTWITKNTVSRGIYSIASFIGKMKDGAPEFYSPSKSKTQLIQVPAESSIPKVVHTHHKGSDLSFIPSIDVNYVPFGKYSLVFDIINSRRFYPVYITGLSGNGKTLMVEQACANSHRECIRVSVTIETDEDDLLGGFRLNNGETIWENGPIVTAMERGAVVLLDEVDLGSNKLLCLQPILEGKPIFLKKIKKIIHPAPGFNIIATANTKGKGSSDGRFIGTNVLNEAFLERFSITINQEYPESSTEVNILRNIINNKTEKNNDFIDILVRWANSIRTAFASGGVTEVISTRRLVHIIQAYEILGGKTNSDKKEAVNLCLNRFDDDVKTSFIEFYDKMVADDEKLKRQIEFDAKNSEATKKKLENNNANTQSTIMVNDDGPKKMDKDRLIADIQKIIIDNDSKKNILEF